MLPLFRVRGEKRSLPGLLFLLLIASTLASSAQKQDGELVRVAQAVVHGHAVHVLVCAVKDEDSKHELRAVLACKQDAAPNCIEPLAGDTGYMEQLDPDLVYSGPNVRVEWLDGKDGTHNTVGLYQVESSSAEKCEVN